MASFFIIAVSVEFLTALYGILELSVLITILFEILITLGIKEASRHVEGVLIFVLIVTAFPYFIAK